MIPLLSVGHPFKYFEQLYPLVSSVSSNNTVNNSLHNKQIQVYGNWEFKQQIYLNNEQYNNHLSSDDPSINRLQQSQMIMTNGNTKHNSANNFSTYTMVLTDPYKAFINMLKNTVVEIN